GVPAWYLLYLPIMREARCALDAKEQESAALHERLRVHDLNVRLAEALEMAEDEDAVLRIARQALSVAADGAPAQLLLADSADSSMRHSLIEGDLPEAVRCFIERPCDCPSVRRGMGTVYEDSLVLSACRGLKGPISSSCAAACTPITVAGSGVGMVRALGPAGDPVLYRLLQALNTAAHHVGARLAVIRSMAASARQAATDPLTGAANRRSAEARMADLAQQPGGYVLAMIDIDHFKKINDGHGHEVGDRALKLLVDTVRRVIRREDVLCRYGGEEFLLILPGIDLANAVGVLQSVRGELPAACAHAGLPAFTISAGVADAPTANPGMQMRAADAALYRAKAAGRDRVLCAEPLAVAATSEERA
ncbi:MAG: GGDEF domain-containing protein, partial [Xanthomonadales bacterium]|nr:GGDEF domain-containing protein [Xanthomonadales bacterium]